MAQPPLILLVDDEPPLRELIRATLGARYRYCEAHDLASALELLRLRVPAVVLLDATLPGESRLDLLREVRDDPALASVRVVVISSWESLDDRDAAFDLGADRFIAKPFSPEELVEAVEELTVDVRRPSAAPSVTKRTPRSRRSRRR